VGALSRHRYQKLAYCTICHNEAHLIQWAIDGVIDSGSLPSSSFAFSSCPPPSSNPFFFTYWFHQHTCPSVWHPSLHLCAVELVWLAANLDPSIHSFNSPSPPPPPPLPPYLFFLPSLCILNWIFSIYSPVLDGKGHLFLIASPHFEC